MTRSSSGTPKARVLPVPVGAWPMTSEPRSAVGSAYSWIANVWVMPTAASASTVSGRTPRAAKVGLSGRTGRNRLPFGAAPAGACRDSLVVSVRVMGWLSVPLHRATGVRDAGGRAPPSTGRELTGAARGAWSASGHTRRGRTAHGPAPSYVAKHTSLPPDLGGWRAGRAGGGALAASAGAGAAATRRAGAVAGPGARSEEHTSEL